jgi:hypothetical protein
LLPILENPSGKLDEGLPEPAKDGQACKDEDGQAEQGNHPPGTTEPIHNAGAKRDQDANEEERQT